jgi:hypothetical protein
MDDGSFDATSELSRLREENASLRHQVELNRTAHDYLIRLAHHFSGEEVEFEDPQEIRTFCERIKRSVTIMINEFKELLTGRRRFQEKWQLIPAPRPSSGIAQGGTRFIRLGDLHGDLGRYLFNWKVPRTEAESTHDQDLRTAIEELKHHQMALLTGFERSFKEGTLEVLRHVSPEAIESGSSDNPDREYLARKMGLVRRGRCWREYQKRFDELIAEDSGWFQTRFLPPFCQGYKEYMWEKKAAQSLDRPPSNEGVR